MTDLKAPWAAVRENTPDGWYVGQPMQHPERGEWSPFAFDPSETPIVGKRSREWTAIGPTELACVREMARCLGRTAGGPLAEVVVYERHQRRCGSHHGWTTPIP